MTAREISIVSLAMSLVVVAVVLIFRQEVTKLRGQVRETERAFYRKVWSD